MSVTAPQPPQQPQQAQPGSEHPDLLSLGQDIAQRIAVYSAGLARAGAPAPAIQRLQQMAGVFHELNQIVAQEQPGALPNPAHQPQPAQPQQAPQAAQPQPQAPQQGGPGNAHPALVSAVQSLAKALPNPNQQ